MLLENQQQDWVSIDNNNNNQPLLHFFSMSLFDLDDDSSLGSTVGEASVVPTAIKTTTKKPPSKRNTFRRLKKGTSYPFLEAIDDKELMMYKCLLLSKPFTTNKGRGVKEAWQMAVEEINQQFDYSTGRPYFDPPIGVKTVRDRFEAVMKVVGELDAAVPWRSGNDDEESPNELRVILEDLFEQKKGFDTAVMEVKGTAAAVAKKNRDAAKAIQQASLGNYKEAQMLLTDTEGGGDPMILVATSSDEGKKKKRETIDRVELFGSAMEERRADKKIKMEMRQKELEAQMEMKKEELAIRKEELAIQRNWMEQQSQQQAQNNLMMMNLMAKLSEKLDRSN